MSAGLVYAPVSSFASYVRSAARWVQPPVSEKSSSSIAQAFHLLAHRSVIENVMLADVYRRAPAGDRRRRAGVALEQVGLGHRADFLPTRLSGGERQRAAIARAPLGSPRLLLCDEPTGNLDSVSSATVLALFAALHDAGMTILMITHDHDVAARAQRRVRISDGTLTELR
jgi:ABC-type lipoprotein export system ATPase subunit